MGKLALKARMPRCLPDHRSHESKRLTRAYVDLLARSKFVDGITRRVALMTAQAWLTYEDLNIEIAKAPAKRRSALDVSRLRRRRQTAAGQFLSGLRSLDVLSNGNGDGKGLDLAAELAKQGLDT